MKLTSRDIAILQFINEFGFCEMPQLNQRFALRKPRNYQIVNKLIRHNLLQHERIFYQRHGLFRLTQAGSRFTSLPPLHRVPLANYQHDLAVLSVYLKLKAFYPNATWISERKLKHDKYKLGVGQQGHLPDGILVFPDGKQIAIEVELSCKSKQRLESILKTYAAQFSLQEVWYFCRPTMLPRLQEAAKGMPPFIKIHSLSEFLEKQPADLNVNAGT
ncbi:MAG: hypothetical protein E6K54_01485 [Gammaproteobacteria bacterium]|nr:MAG: hypothetical protein E6K54_01485 [Gammaproteobacteria bacterium]